MLGVVGEVVVGADRAGRCLWRWLQGAACRVEARLVGAACVLPRMWFWQQGEVKHRGGGSWRLQVLALAVQRCGGWGPLTLCERT